ncbi:MAG: flagellar biosynthesis protein FlhF [Planctomycetota bacterium]|jgi:flagellar biosynthesis protein FlhF
MDKNNYRKFVGKTATQALSDARQSMGNDAVIISQRNLFEITASAEIDGALRQDKFYGATIVEAMSRVSEELGHHAGIVAQNDLIELTVAPGEETGISQTKPSAAKGNVIIQKAYGAAMSAYNKQNSTENGLPDMGHSSQGRGLMSGAMLKEINDKLDELHRIARSPERPSVSSDLIDYYFNLVENDVTEDIARHLVEKMNNELDGTGGADPEKIRNAMLEAISRLIPVGGPIRLRGDERPTVVVLVGPTGVGKTTSIAKLAMQFKLQHKCRVGLITEDTSRPGAEEQLRSVAQLLSIPLTVADTVDRIKKAVSHSADRDIIFIDTAGRVPRNKESIQELAGFLDEIKPDEVHLALCGLSGCKHVLDTIRRFDVIDFDKLILTKLDEATTYGLILNIAANVDKGLSYITTGQDYMENIEAGNSDKLASLVLCSEQDEG